MSMYFVHYKIIASNPGWRNYWKTIGYQFVRGIAFPKYVDFSKWMKSESLECYGWVEATHIQRSCAKKMTKSDSTIFSPHHITIGQSVITHVPTKEFPLPL